MKKQILYAPFFVGASLLGLSAQAFPPCPTPKAVKQAIDYVVTERLGQQVLTTVGEPKTSYGGFNKWDLVLHPGDGETCTYTQTAGGPAYFTISRERE